MTIEKIQKKRIRAYVFAFCVNLLLALLVFLPFLIKDGGLFSLSNDFNAQELPFNIFANREIKNGQIFFNWSIDIGSDFISSFSFYNLGSPFFWITLLFPATVFPYLVGWIFILKYAAAGLLAFVYLEPYVKDKNIAIFGSILYAFSGFQSANIVFYHFHDVVAFFPLLLSTFDQLILKGKRGYFALAIGINALVNWNFFVGEVIFVIIYYFIRFSPLQNIKVNLKKTLSEMGYCLLEGILGIGIACFLFVPSIYTMLNNTRVGNHILGVNGIAFSTTDYLQFLKALLLPNETLIGQSVLENSNWYSIAAYLPLISIAFVMAYFISCSKNWINRILLCSLVIAIIPVLNNSFTLFNTESYRRWYYMPILIMALASCQVLEGICDNGTIRLKKVVCRCIGTLLFLDIILTLYLICFKWSDSKESAVNNLGIYFIYLSIGMVGLIITYFVVKHVFSKKIIGILTVMTALFGCITTGLNIIHYQHMSEVGSPKKVYNEILKTTDKLQTDILPFRYEMLYDPYYNRNMANSLTSKNSFISTVNNGIFEFYDSIDYHRHTSTPVGPEGTNELLSVKYYISDRSDLGEPEAIVNNGNKDIYIYKSQNPLPIGFTYNTYITQSEFKTIKKEERALVMLRTLVVPDMEESKVQQYLIHYNLETAEPFNFENSRVDIESHKNESSVDFYHSTNGFSSKIIANEKKYAFFSVPYENRWSATVNGKNVEIINVNGLMAIPIERGQNKIVFMYSKWVHYLGVVITIVSLGIWLLYFLKNMKKGGNS